MMIALAIATAFIVVVTLLPMSRHSHWLVRGLDFPRLQFAFIALVLLLFQLSLLDLSQGSSWLLIVPTLASLAWQSWWIAPYTRLWRPEVKSAASQDYRHEISILTANVLTTNRNADALISLVQTRRPDILVTLESDQWWQERLDVLSPTMPYAIKCPLDNLYGMHVYSRLPLTDSDISYLVEEDVPSMHACVELRCGDKVRMHFLHPAPPSPTENEESAQRDAELIVVARSVAKSDQPVIVTGDLNDVAWSATTRLFRKISGLLDPRVGRGMFNTYHAQLPFLRWPLDHLFHTQHFCLRQIERLAPIGSDHFALFAVLKFNPDRGTQGEGLEAEKEDRKWAKTITQAQDVHRGEVPEPGE
mgnify:CR=1 FL=1